MAEPVSGRQPVPPTPDRLPRLLREIAAASRGGRLREALRLADTAQRMAPRQPTVQMLRVRLMSQLGQTDQALALLETERSIAATVLRIELLLDAERHTEAVEASTALLRSHALDELPGLPRLLDQLCAIGGLPGWVGMTSSLKCIAHVHPASKVVWQQGDVVRTLEAATAATQWIPVELPAPLHDHGLILVGTPSGVALLGAPLDWPPDLRAGGWVLHEGTHLRGELRLDWARRLPRLLVVRGGATLIERVALAPKPGDERWLEFRVALRPEAQGMALTVALECPDASLLALAGSPALPPAPLAVATRSALLQPVRTARGRGRPAPASAITDVIVPVYRGRSDTLRCLDSVLRTTARERVELIVIDDASPDAELRTDLQALAAAGKITLLENPHNLGFPATVNRGLALHDDRDVVILNADCTVHGDWLERLQRAAYSAADIATVTPLGRAAAILSYPVPSAADGAADPAPPDAAELDQLAARVNAGRYVDIPVGVGFCMLIRRTALLETGLFDADAFLRGYAEEGDLCLRASQLGWRHLAATDVFVDHVGGQSFGAEGQAWRRRNHALILRRHPDYDRLVERFIATDALHGARRALDLERLGSELKHAPAARTLLVTLGLPGGVQRHVGERIAAIEQEGGMAVLLRPQGETPGRVELVPTGVPLQDLQFDWPNDADLLTQTLGQLGLRRIELHHFLDLPAGLIDAVVRLGVPYTVALHDHAWICPRLTLTGGDKRYCGEPELAACEACISAHGSELEAGLSVQQLRARSARWLTGAERVLAPSRDVEQRYRRYFPGLAIRRRAWEAPIRPRQFIAPARGERTRVLVLGAISEQKGFHVLRDCAERAAVADLPIEFVLVGYSEDDGALLDTGRVFITGPYKDEELKTLLEREACQVAWFPAVAPETWCYALSHAMRRGMPILGFDLGAIGERLRAYPSGAVVPLESTPQALIDRLLLCSGAESATVSPSEPPASEPMTEVDDVVPTATPPAKTDLPLHSASVQPLVLPEGVYAFGVPEGGAHIAEPEAPDTMRLPAMGIGPAPTGGTALVELVPAPGTQDRWLTRPGDQVTARITGGSAMLLLTSVRKSGTPPLAIEIRRLDQALVLSATAERPSLQTLLHVHLLGDLYFGTPQAGPLGSGLGVEALVVDCRDAAGANLAEYRASTADGFETPWLSDGMLCGSRGRGVALLGFAVRARVTAARRYQFRYRGYFRGAGWVEWVPHGTWCRSPLPNDPLEGLEIDVSIQGV